MLKLREVIEIKVWSDNGWGERQTISDRVINSPYKSIEDLRDNYDWYWWIENEWYNEMEEGDDLEITITYYDPDDEESEPLAEVVTWQSEIE